MANSYYCTLKISGIASTSTIKSLLKSMEKTGFDDLPKPDNLIDFQCDKQNNPIAVFALYDHPNTMIDDQLSQCLKDSFLNYIWECHERDGFVSVATLYDATIDEKITYNIIENEIVLPLTEAANEQLRFKAEEWSKFYNSRHSLIKIDSNHDLIRFQSKNEILQKHFEIFREKNKF